MNLQRSNSNSHSRILANSATGLSYSRRLLKRCCSTRLDRAGLSVACLGAGGFGSVIIGFFAGLGSATAWAGCGFGCTAGRVAGAFSGGIRIGMAVIFTASGTIGIGFGTAASIGITTVSGG